MDWPRQKMKSCALLKTKKNWDTSQSNVLHPKDANDGDSKKHISITYT